MKDHSFAKGITAVLYGILGTLSVCAGELLENTDFSGQSDSGASFWTGINDTRTSISGQTLSIERSGGKALVIQKFRPRPGKPILFTVEVKCRVPDKVRAYIECEFMDNVKVNVKSSGASWQEAKAGEWITLAGIMSPLPSNYSKCCLAVWNESGETMEIRNPHAEIMENAPLIFNGDFRIRNGKNALCWNYEGKEEETLSCEPGIVRFSNGYLIQRNLPLTAGTEYKCTFSMRGGEGAEGRCYVEWIRHKSGEKKAEAQNFGSGWQKAADVWKTCSFRIALSQEADLPYIVLGAKNETPVEFKDVRIEKINPTCDLGGQWRIYPPHEYTDAGLVLVGKKGAVSLRGIPVMPGKKYKLSFNAEVLEDKVLSEDGGFFRIRTTVTPEGIIGSQYIADILHGKENEVQERAHVFYIPADSGIEKIHFSVLVRNPGRVRLSRFALNEITAKASDFWNVKILRPFYRDSFFPGDDVSAVEGEAQSKGADALRITLDDQTVEIPVAGDVTKFQIPFDRPEGKYTLQCDFLKDGKVEKSFTKTITRFPVAPNVVTVTPDRKIRINGKIFFPNFMSIRPRITDESLYFAARAGVNVAYMFMRDEAPMLKDLDLAQKYGMKMIIQSGAPFKATGLPRFRKDVERFLTRKVITHPALLGYELPDEPMLAGMKPEVLQEEYRILKDHDPYHLVWVNLAPRNGVEDLKPFGEACDLLSVDIYPIPYPNSHSGLEDKTPACCGKYALRLNEIACGKKALFVYLQGFAWHECETLNPNTVKKRYPTRTESRFMAYDSILNGGNSGYWLWGTGHVQSKDFYRMLREMTTEMYRYSGLFSEGTQLPDMATSNPAVRCAVMECNGRKYYFLLNLTAEPQQAEIAIRGNVLDSDGGIFADGKVSLSPYEVISISEAPLPAPQYELPPENSELEKPGDPAYKAIDELNRTLSAPLYTGKANWIWYADGQHDLARCFAEKKFTVEKTGEKVTLQVAADDQFIAYLNGEEILCGTGFTKMFAVDLTKKVRPGENRLTVLGIDGRFAPCGILAELHVGDQVLPTDTSWKVKAAFKDDPLPESLDNEANAVILAPFGARPWGREIRVFSEL